MILLDTHVLIWMGRDPRKLTRRAAQAIRRAHSSGGLAISCMSLFEIAHLSVRGRLALKAGLDVVLSEVEKQCVILPLTTSVVVAAARLPEAFPADPMDRIIGATAQVEGIALVTADARIRAAKIVETVW